MELFLCPSKRPGATHQDCVTIGTTDGVVVVFAVLLHGVRDCSGVAKTYSAEIVSTLFRHPLEDHTIPDLPLALPSMKHMSGVTGNTFLQLLEVYVDDFIQVVQSSDMTVL